MGEFFNKAYHTMNERNSDYFLCEKQNKTVKEIGKTTYKNIEHMRAVLLQLNLAFGETDGTSVGLICNMKSLYG